MKPPGGGVARQVKVQRSRLYPSDALRNIHGKNLVHHRRDDHHRFAEWNCVSRQPGSGTARNERPLITIAHFDRLRHLGGGGGKNHYGRLVADAQRGVSPVDSQFKGIDANALGGCGLAQLGDQIPSAPLPGGAPGGRSLLTLHFFTLTNGRLALLT